MLIPKTLHALLVSRLNSTILLGVLTLWRGVCPVRYLGAVWLLASLISFFTGGGLTLVRVNREWVVWFSWLFPNTYAVDPLRDLILFQHWPADWGRVIWTFSEFDAGGLIWEWGMVIRGLQRRD